MSGTREVKFEWRDSVTLRDCPRYQWEFYLLSPKEFQEIISGKIAVEGSAALLVIKDDKTVNVRYLDRGVILEEKNTVLLPNPCCDITVHQITQLGREPNGKLKKTDSNQALFDSMRQEFIYSTLQIGLHEVGVSESGIGNFIYSDNFGPCYAVLADLLDGQFAVYHAFLPANSGKGSPFEKFITLLPDKIDFIYVFEKSSPKKHAMLAPVLAIELSKELGDVKRIALNDYRAIICDVEQNRVIFTNQLITETTSDMKEVKIITLDKKSEPIDARKTISLEQSAMEFLQLQSEGRFTDISIPDELLKEVFTPHEESLDEDKELSTIFTDKARIKPTLFQSKPPEVKMMEDRILTISQKLPQMDEKKSQRKEIEKEFLMDIVGYYKSNPTLSLKAFLESLISDFVKNEESRNLFNDVLINHGTETREILEKILEKPLEELKALNPKNEV